MTTPVEMVVGKYPAQLLLDILTDGIEWSARGFWAQIYEYKWTRWYENEGNDFPQIIAKTMTPDTVLLRVRDVEDEDAEEDAAPDSDEWKDITLAKLAEATDWALENYNHLMSWHTNNQGIRDEIDYDAVGADVIIQKIVLGEVIYG